jgi:formamidopyrimidine-DNA glycosylase
MPELPEAETIARDIDGRVRDAVVDRVRVPRPDILAPGLSAATLSRRLAGHRILRVHRRGKNVLIELDHDLRVLINLGMTGHLITTDAPLANEMRHIAARFILRDGRSLLFDDMRRFGRIDLRDATTWPARDAELGVEPLSDEFTADLLFALTRRTIVPLRNWLLDQRRIAGVGNIYANEALFRAGVRPTRRARRLTRREAARLRAELRAVLADAIAARGTTIDDYRDGSGESGGFQARLRVYGRHGEPCVVCGTPIKRIVLTNRSAFYCPRCQR